MRPADRSDAVRFLFPVLLFAALVCAGVSGTVGAAQPAGTDPGPGSLAREITSDGSYQTELPVRIEVNPPVISGWSFGPLPKLVSVALLVALAVVAVAWGWVKLFPGDTLSPEAAPARATPGEEDRSSTGPEAPARLAEQGLYDQAIHALLMLSIGAISRRLGVSTARGLTSRELLEVFPLDEARSRAFAGLVAAVEVSHFGGIEAVEGDYVRCVEYYRTSAEEAA